MSEKVKGKRKVPPPIVPHRSEDEIEDLYVDAPVAQAPSDRGSIDLEHSSNEEESVGGDDDVQMAEGVGDTGGVAGGETTPRAPVFFKQDEDEDVEL